MAIAFIFSYEIITGSDILPEITGAIMAVAVIGASFGYAFTSRNNKREEENLKQQQDRK